VRGPGLRVRVIEEASYCNGEGAQNLNFMLIVRFTQLLYPFGQVDWFVVDASSCEAPKILTATMDVYKVNLGCLLALCGTLFAAQRTSAPKPAAKEQNGKKAQVKKEVDGSEAVQWAFLAVYSLVMGADWLQVPNHPNPPSSIS
jgi:hypothetical protein